METTEHGSKYQTGQVWSYRSRPQDIDSILTIVQIDSDLELGNIIHISVQGLSLRNPGVEGGISSTFPHLPMSEQAMDMCVERLLRTTDVIPDFTAGYQEWRRAFDAKQAGIFTIPVAECIDIAEQAMVAAHPVQNMPTPGSLLNEHDVFLAQEIERLKNQPRQFPDQAPNDLFGELSVSLSKAYKLSFVESIDTVFDYCKRNAVDIPLPPHVSDSDKAASPKRKWWQFWR